MGKPLRSGFTTGACAAAAARAAAAALISQRPVPATDVTFPDGSTVVFTVVSCSFDPFSAAAAVIKDAGDDPDVTNGARIEARVRFSPAGDRPDIPVSVNGGEGVGVVTKPGLAVEVGQPAINPVPLQMIKENVVQVMASNRCARPLEVTILVPEGRKLSKKTLNERLGIIGGISILGTTGIVRPVSAEAWTATIQSSMSVAQANGIEEIVLSTGRTSEKCVERSMHPRQEALVMMGDYLDFSLKESGKYRFTRVHVATMWAKLIKGVLGYGQTHVRHGILDTREVCTFLEKNEIRQTLVDQLKATNTAREILDILLGNGAEDVVHLVCRQASKAYAQKAGLPVTIHLVHNNALLMTVG